MCRRKQREQELFQKITGSLKNKILKVRLQYLLEWYDEKSQRSRCFYNALRTSSVLLPILAAALSLFAFLGDEKNLALLTSLVSLVTAFLSHLLDQYRFYDSWIRYRTTAEALKNEVFRCLGSCPPYSGTQEDRELQLAGRVEEIAAEEVSKWRELRRKQAEQEQSPDEPPQDDPDQ